MNRAMLIDHVRRQMNFIVTSCNAYDAGIRPEAVRIATAARVLFHVTNNSRSLLRSQLGLRNLKLRSTSVPVTGPKRSFIGFIGLDPSHSSFRHYGDDSPCDKQVELDTWWNDEPILKLASSDETVTRKQLVIAAANKDGGAHVDDARSTEYDRLEAGLNIKTVIGYRDGSRRTVTLRFANLAALRQIGHEILSSAELIQLVEKSPIIDPWTGARIGMPPTYTQQHDN
jgi:hypothetical protein